MQHGFYSCVHTGRIEQFICAPFQSVHFPGLASIQKLETVLNICFAQADWDDAYDNVLSSQRQLEVSLVQWTSFEDSYNQLEQWMKTTEIQFSDILPLHNTLEEKKTQLNTYKVGTVERMNFVTVIWNRKAESGCLYTDASFPLTMTVTFFSQNLLQDVLSYERVIDNTMEKAQTLSGGSTDPRLKANMEDIKKNYGKLQEFAKVKM